MRIIAGLYKSRKLVFPKSKTTRPMTDRAKETIFNVLGETCNEANVLDLFAGSGSLGLEALSRGAQQATFVDDSREAQMCIRKNLENLDLFHQGSLMPVSVFLGLERIEKQAKTYRLIFLDPPHNKGLIKKVLRHLDRSDIVAPFGVIVVGHSNLEGLPDDLKTLKIQRSIKIGQTFMSFLSKTGQTS